MGQILGKFRVEIVINGSQVQCVSSQMNFKLWCLRLRKLKHLSFRVQGKSGKFVCQRFQSFGNADKGVYGPNKCGNNNDNDTNDNNILQ